MKNQSIPLLLATVIMLSAPASADSFRCGRKVIRTGDSSADVMQKCGSPQSRDSAQEEVWLNRTQQTIRVERWHYKQGTSKLGRVVLVYRGEVVGVRTGSR